MSFRLLGLPEAVVGRSVVQAETLEDLFRRYPELARIRGKLTVEGQVIRGYEPCDG